MAPRDMVIEHPNRDKPESKATKGIVVVLLIISVALLVIITLGGGDKLEGAWPIQVAYILLYALMAFRITQWRSGLLPVVAALAIILAIFAAVAGPDWLARDKDGYESPPMDSDLLGILTFVVVPVQALLIGFAMRGFGQKWSVEVERYADGTARTAT